MEPSKYLYFGQAGGSRIMIAGRTVRHDLTGASKVDGGRVPNRSTNLVAGADVLKGVAKLGAIRTEANARAVRNGTQVVTKGRTARLSLFKGLIAADAVETTNTAVKRSTGMRSRSNTTFVNLRIGERKIPVNVAENTTITIPGLVRVVLNGHYGGTQARGMYSYGFGLYAELLRPYKDLPAAAQVVLNPTASLVSAAPPPGAPMMGGHAYGSRIDANVGDALGVHAGPTGRVQLPPNGTYGQTLQNATAQVDVSTGPLRKVLHLDAVKSWGWGESFAGYGKGWTKNRIAGLRLLNNTITADAIQVKAVTVKRPGRAIKRRFATRFVNLKVLGEEIDVHVSPNTEIRIADLGVLRLNTQRKTPNGARAIGLKLKLSTERYGLPAGAVIEAGYAETWMYSR